MKLHPIEEGEPCHLLFQKLCYFSLKLWIFLAVEPEMQAKAVGFLKRHGCLRMAVAQGEADRWILRDLRHARTFSPVFHKGDVRWGLPFDTAMDGTFVHKIRSWYLKMVVKPLSLK